MESPVTSFQRKLESHFSVSTPVKAKRFQLSLAGRTPKGLHEIPAVARMT
jgi:hypothetical protein